MIVLTLVIHVVGLGLINRRIASVSNGAKERRYPPAAFAVIMGATTLSATILHGAEAAIWAAAYRLPALCLPNDRNAVFVERDFQLRTRESVSASPAGSIWGSHS